MIDPDQFPADEPGYPAGKVFLICLLVVCLYLLTATFIFSLIGLPDHGKYKPSGEITHTTTKGGDIE